MRPRVVFAALLGLLSACQTAAPAGDCGPVLTSAECQIVRAQLGALPAQPPADPTSRVGRWTGGAGPEKDAEDKAAELGQRLFFDRCLSSDKQTGCVTCHEPSTAFVDVRDRELARPVSVTQGGMTTTMALPPIKDPTPERVRTPPPAVEPELDPTGAPLAYWDAAAGQWRGVLRRPQVSRSSEGKAYTGRNSPTLYNVAYGAVTPPADGARTAGVTWVPWDGRYDSVWALVSDVFEFGATQRTDRAHVALRISRKHRAQYEAAFGALPDLDARVGLIDPQLRYPRHASPNTGFTAAWVDCWKGTGTGCPKDPETSLPVMPVDDQVREDINTIYAAAGKALSAYIRRLRSGDSAYDRWLAGDPSALSLEAQRGLRLFIGKAECVLCHSGPNFTDWRFHNLGVPGTDAERRAAGSDLPPPAPESLQSPATCQYPGTAPAPGCADPGRWAWQSRLAGQCAPALDETGHVRRDQMGQVVFPACQRSDGLSCFSSVDKAMSKPYSDDPAQCLPEPLFERCRYADAATCKARPLCAWYEEAGVCAPAVTASDLGAFKTPSLRNAAKTWPYMHNGALYDFGPAERGETSADDPTPHLTRVVEFYNQGGARPPVGALDPLIRPLHLERGEVRDLVEFLKALTDDSVGSGPLGRAPGDLADVSDCPQ